MSRLRNDLPIHWEVVAEEPFRQGSEHRAVLKEEERIMARLDRSDWVILLDVPGRMISSEELSGKLEGWREGARPVVLVIGGSLGVGKSVTERADWRWSLSPLTFPHGLAHVVVAEQLYRAWTILKGHPYHKA